MESTELYWYSATTFGMRALMNWSTLWTLPRRCRYFTHSLFRPIHTSSLANHLMTAPEMQRKTSKSNSSTEFTIFFRWITMNFLERSDSSASMRTGQTFMAIIEKPNSLRRNTIGGGRPIQYSTIFASLNYMKVSCDKFTNWKFENDSKCRHWIFWYFLPIFVLLKLACLVTMFAILK